MIDLGWMSKVNWNWKKVFVFATGNCLCQWFIIPPTAKIRNNLPTGIWFLYICTVLLVMNQERKDRLKLHQTDYKSVVKRSLIANQPQRLWTMEW